MTGIDFTPWPKIARLNRDIVVSEKLDGTNAAVIVFDVEEIDHIDRDGELYLFDDDQRKLVANVDDRYAVFAQSRTRFIMPKQDNYGFATWVERNASMLVEDLGTGIHFGEWWGSGIQRKYGRTGGDKSFSLFNTSRWGNVTFETPNLEVVPKLYEGPYDQNAIDLSLELLRSQGSIAAPGFDRPEGIVIFHSASRDFYKITLEGDEAPKGAEGHKLDEEVTR